jgi:hypothetical protein
MEKAIFNSLFLKLASSASLALPPLTKKITVNGKKSFVKNIQNGI